MEQQALAELAAKIGTLSYRDQARLNRRVNQLGGAAQRHRKNRTSKNSAAHVPESRSVGDRDSDLLRDVAAAQARIQARAESIPKIVFDAELPVSGRYDEIVDAISGHQVVVLAGETGSGKSTQLPKICLAMGRGVKGLIGHTQPRRLAARSIASRISAELGVASGSLVGFSVRFSDSTSDDTLVKVMTDGILLAEIARDPMLLAYDTLIIDEAHERTLNIDFLLGYLTELLPKRPELKLIVTSATIDVDKFAKHFERVTSVSTVNVTGRSFPVEIRYRPFGVDDDRDQNQAIADAVEELCGEGRGDVLVFLSGEREISDAAEALTGSSYEVLPLYARLTVAEQQRIFDPHSTTRVVLSTNVAETSLTVPGIRYVVDVGTARISRFNKRLKVQQLPIEPVSQASANQRSGRCGRVAPGIAIRLYDEDDFAKRAEFTDPEILRTNLASVILQATLLGFGEISTFPFVERPHDQAIRDGKALLVELGALDSSSKLTKIGTDIARLPLDPRLARIIIAAGRLGCTAEVLIIVAALSIQDPRERPQTQREQANAFHARYRKEGSDFLGVLALWDHLKLQQAELSKSAFRRRCRSEFLNFQRIREWQDIYSQLKQATREIGVPNTHRGAHPDKVHQALLTGLISHIAVRDDREAKPPEDKRDKRRPNQREQRKRSSYIGARNSSLQIGQDSVLSKRPPKWLMAAELVETTGIWARVCAEVDPNWVVDVAEHLIKRSYDEPVWNPSTGNTSVNSTVFVYGLQLLAPHRVSYAHLNQAGARAIFIREALVRGNWASTHEFQLRNASLLVSVGDLENRIRRRDLCNSEAEFEEFFNERIPSQIVSAKHFNTWWAREKLKSPSLLDYSFSTACDFNPISDLIAESEAKSDAYGPVDHSPTQIDWADVEDAVSRLFPDTIDIGGLVCPVSYLYDTADDADGVTVELPLAAIIGFDPDPARLLPSGYLRDYVAELIKLQPKYVRKHLVPIVEHADQFLHRYNPEKPFDDQFCQILGHLAATPIEPLKLDQSQLPAFLRPRIAVVDRSGKTVASSRDLPALQAQLVRKAQRELSGVLPTLEVDNFSTWPLEAIPRRVEGVVGKFTVYGYPSLVDEGSRVSLRVLTSRHDQEVAMWLGTTRLVFEQLEASKRRLARSISADRKVVLGFARHGLGDEIFSEIILSCCEHLIARAGGPVWNKKDFMSLVATVGSSIDALALRTARTAAEVLDLHDTIDDKVAQLTAPVYDEACVDISLQLLRLVPDNFVNVHGVSHLDNVVRYLKALQIRLEKLVSDPSKDLAKLASIKDLEQEAASTRNPRSVVAALALLDELRVSTFAQTLGTKGAVSRERVLRELRN